MNRYAYWLGALMVLVSAFCFALKGIFIKMAYEYGIDTISLLTLRMGFSAPIYAVVAASWAAKNPDAKFTKPQWWWVAGLGIWGYYVSSYLNFLGFHYITAGLERVLLFTYPTFVLIINAVVRKKSVTRLQVGALALTYAGILVAFFENLDTGQNQNVGLGALWVILSGLTYAFFLVGSEKTLGQIDTQKFTSYAMLSATVATLVHCFLQNGLRIWHYPARVYWIALGMAIFSTAIPTFLLAAGIKRVGASNTSIINSIGPIFTIFLATTALGEYISWLQIFGTLLVLFGVFLIGWKGKK
ncbi:MAG: DMT family transporter [Spirosomaceae bacterium]|jgi:drug/metabolite transporter (DMT)-like permease|nr:DMT family transporter [Spirosomataceae bacterium]